MRVVFSNLLVFLISSASCLTTSAFVPTTSRQGVVSSANSFSTSSTSPATTRTANPLYLHQQKSIFPAARYQQQHHIPNKNKDTTTKLCALPPPHVWTSILPPFLGLHKSEWTVSIGYGTAVALSAAVLTMMMNPTTTTSTWAQAHGRILVAYGVRLNIFLILRNVLSTRIQEINQRIEDRALAKGGNRFATRLPFILSCGMLYYGLAIPVWFTGKLLPTTTATAAAVLGGGWKQGLLRVLLTLQWIGFGVAALGDWTKTYVKRTQGDEKFLVTSGIFSRIRHPNYSGEILGWTGNFLMGLVAAGLTVGESHFSGGSPAVLFGNLALMVLGWAGIVFVLLRATSNLEARQAKEYGDLEKYQAWRNGSWGGWQLPTPKAKEEEHAVPHLELDEESIEESGSGI